MNNYSNDFETRYATYLALGGEPKEFANIFEVDLAILEIIQQGIGGDFKTNHYMDADGRLIVERGEDGRTVISDEHENPIIERLADGTTKIFDAYQGERMTISANGNITFQELTSLSNQVTSNTQAIQAIAATGGASTAEAVLFADGENLAVKSEKWTKKIRVDIVPSGTSYKFMLGEQELNFADLNRMLQETPDFVVFVYDNREHRCVRIELDGGTKFMEFTSPIIEGVNTKAQSFLVTSVNGTQIFTVKRTDIINENKTDADATRNKLNDVSARATVKLEGIGPNWRSVKTSGWSIGEMMYNNVDNVLRKVKSLNDEGGVLEWDTPNPELSRSAIYIVNNDLYVWNGSELISKTNDEINAIKEEINDIYDYIGNDNFAEITPTYIGQYITFSPNTVVIDPTPQTLGNYNSTILECKSGDYFTINGESGNTARLWAFTDEDYRIISRDTSNVGEHLNVKIVAPAGTKYLFLNDRSGTHTSYIGVDLNYKLQDINDRIDNPTRMSYNNLLGKKVAFIGDSITAGGDANAPIDKLYHKIFANLYGCINKNLGIWSTCIASNTTNTDGKPDSDPTSPKYHRFVLRATAENLADCSLVVVFGGTNDYTYDSKPIGDLFKVTTITPSGPSGDKQYSAIEDTDTFAGAVHELINTIRNVAPNVPIVFITPLLKNRNGNTSRKCNKWGDSTRDFADAIIEICKFYSIPVLDAAAISQLDFTNDTIASTYSSDGLHPNIEGHKLLGNLLYRFVENNVVIS